MEQHQESVVKPSRSDEIIDPDQQRQITDQIRAQFESLAPKRPTKPNRSESEDAAASPSSNHPDGNFPVPELQKLKSLQSQSQIMINETGAVVQEEFTETGYYRELDSVDKQHHTTGSGFIKVASETSGENYDLQLPRSNENSTEGVREIVYKTNPATNDWIPKIDDYQVEYVSSKPNRSESG